MIRQGLKGAEKVVARDTDHLAVRFEAENTGGLLSGFLAEEDPFDRNSLWRLGSWGAASVSAVIVALLVNQSSIGMRREQVAAADLARQAQQIQSVAKESENEARRLASAIDTLNGDRDRLYSRVTVLEQGLDTVTGTIARQSPAAASPQAAAVAAATTEPQAASQNPAPAPAVSPVTTTVAKTAERPKMDATVAAEKPKTDKMVAAEKPKADTTVAEQGPATVASAAQSAPTTSAVTPAATPLMAAKSMMAPPDAAAGKLIEPDKPLNTTPSNATPAPPAPETVASVSPAEADSSEATDPKFPVQRTEFAVDIGGANSIGGLRALWRGLLKSNTSLAELRPIIVVREGRTGLGLQLRLVAGPLGDAAAAAKICAGLIENQRTCETTVFDGQRLVMKADEPAGPAKPASRRRTSRHVTSEDGPRKPETSTLASFFGRR
jgi:hypothetical protein